MKIDISNSLQNRKKSEEKEELLNVLSGKDLGYLELDTDFVEYIENSREGDELELLQIDILESNSEEYTIVRVAFKNHSIGTQKSESGLVEIGDRKYSFYVKKL